jgi:hypothetical protein
MQFIYISDKVFFAMLHAEQKNIFSMEKFPGIILAATING